MEAERIFRSVGRGARPRMRRHRRGDLGGRPAVAADPVAGAVPPRPRRRGGAADSLAVEKARDLLKILVARRGRATTRDTFFELLWPDDDPEPLGNRLSVALATVRSVLDPDKQFPAEFFVPADKGSIALDLDHIELDVEDSSTRRPQPRLEPER